MTIEWASSALESLRDVHFDTAAITPAAAEAILDKLLDEIDRSLLFSYGQRRASGGYEGASTVGYPPGCFIPNFR
jgi:plasmid stabilization system protein ParE